MASDEKFHAPPLLYFKELHYKLCPVSLSLLQVGGAL